MLAVCWSQVVELLWNLESTVLAVWCETLTPDGDSNNFVSDSYGNESFIMLAVLFSLTVRKLLRYKFESFVHSFLACTTMSA